jgi:class 3 adenylate cyclase
MQEPSPNAAPAREPVGVTDQAGATLTFLFTDIEGSTRLEQAIGTRAYGDLRERHRALLRAAFTAAGGEEQGTEGDSFFVVFRSARGAIAAALAAQRALAAEPWPAEAPIRVRMGVHSGEARALGGSLVGMDINRAARIAAAANGGQVLVSDVTRSLVRDEALEGIAFRDLGSHRLKDLHQPEQLHQLVADGLRGEFPPPRTIDARATNLPTQLTSFVGREAERTAVSGLRSTTSPTASSSPPSTPCATRAWSRRRSRAPWVSRNPGAARRATCSSTGWPGRPPSSCSTTSSRSWRPPPSSRTCSARSPGSS